MDNAAEINLYNNTLVLANKKLLFEGNLIYDFEDRYHNISSLGVEQQIQIFSQLIKLIYDTNLSNAVKAETIMIFAFEFKALSARNTSSSVLSIGENIFNNTYAEVLSLFGKENKLYESSNKKELSLSKSNNITSILLNEDFSMDFLSDNYFSVILINFDLVKNNIETILDECCRLVNRNGNIICYGSDVHDLERVNNSLLNNASLYQLSSEGFLITIDLNGNKTSACQDDIKEQILSLIQSKNSELVKILQYIMSNHPSSENDNWYRMMDKSIKIMTEIEAIVAKNHTVFDNKDLKFQTNEVKNSLLDFKYEAYLNRKHYNFFQSKLFDCYNSWADTVL